MFPFLSHVSNVSGNIKECKKDWAHTAFSVITGIYISYLLSLGLTDYILGIPFISGIPEHSRI